MTRQTLMINVDTIIANIHFDVQASASFTSSNSNKIIITELIELFLILRHRVARSLYSLIARKY